MAVDKFSGTDFSGVIASRIALEKALERLEETVNSKGHDAVRQRIRNKIGRIRFSMAAGSDQNASQ